MERYDPFLRETKVDKGDFIGWWPNNPQIRVSLYNKFNDMRREYYTTKNGMFILEKCPLNNHGLRIKSLKILQFMVDLLEENFGEYLSCESIRKNLKKLKMQLPAYATCYECPYYTLFIKSKKEKNNSDSGLMV